MFNRCLAAEQDSTKRGKMSKQQAGRLAYIDNLRWMMIVLVVGMHAACTYSQIGSWYFRSEITPDPVSRLVFICFQASLQAFFMGFMFFLAGYFVPAAYDRKGFARFIGERIVRLGAPTLLYVFVIHIGIGLFLLDWYGKSGLSPVAAYGYYLTHGKWLSGTGPLWFAVALLFFSLIYGLIRLVLPRLPASPVAPTPPRFAAIIAIGLAMGAVTFLVRQVAPVGASWYNMQFCFFPQYTILFVLGILARRRGWIETLPARWGKPVLLTAAIGAPLSLIVLVVLISASHSDITTTSGGMHWQAAFYAFWEQIFCVLFCTGLLIVFRDAFNIRSRLIGFLSDNGFAVYVIHAPVLIAITLLMRPLSWPPLALFAFAWACAVIASFILGALLRQVPGMKRIL